MNRKRNKINNNNLRIFRKPSPTCYPVSSRNHFSHTFNKRIFIERMSLLTPQSKTCSGSMTVEACFILPLVLLFFLQLMSFMQMLHVHGQMTFALWNTGQKLCVYTALEEETQTNLFDRVVAYLYVKNSVENLLGQEFFEEAPIENGLSGIYFSEAIYGMGNGYVDLIANYQVDPKVSLLPLGYKRLCNHYYGRAWTGYDVTNEEASNRYVYITKYGEVWHATVSCKYLTIEVEAVPFLSMDQRVNAYGEKYSCCSVCRKAPLTGTVYLTSGGTKFHLSEECSTLKRNIEVISWEEKDAYRPCSKCVLSGEE